jgi:hypothetical protein
MNIQHNYKQLANNYLCDFLLQNFIWLLYTIALYRYLFQKITKIQIFCCHYANYEKFLKRF